MGQLFFTDQNGRRWMCGWDNPSQGYYASRENDADDPCAECQEEYCGPDCQHFMNEWQEFDILIGFGKGILTLEELDAEMSKCGFVMDKEQKVMLYDDRFRQERPLTPLQENIRNMFKELI